MYFEKIFQVLNQHGVRYVVIGGVAVNLHGFARATGDLDVAVSLIDKDMSKLIAAVKELGLVPRVPVKLEDLADAKKRAEWIRDKNMLAFSVYNPKDPMEQLDVMIQTTIDFETLLKNCTVMKEAGFEIPVASIEDLIVLKQHSGRQRDKIDIEALKEIQELKNEK